MRQTFVDPEWDTRLHRDGFVKVSLLDADALAALREEVTSLQPADGFDPSGGTSLNPATYHCTFLDADRTYKLAFDEIVRRRFTPVIDEWLVDYRILIANCYVKPPGRGEFEVHQNWNLTTERSDVTLTLWVPLQDTDVGNGTLQVVPGSHKLTLDVAYPRGDHYFTGFDARIAERYFQPIAVGAGEAVFFDDSLIHGSALNQSDSPRFTLQIALIPRGSTPVVYFPREDGMFDLLEGDERLYLDTTQDDIDRWPSMFRCLGRVPNQNQRLDEDTFAGLLTNADDVRHQLWGFPLPGADATPPPPLAAGEKPGATAEAAVLTSDLSTLGLLVEVECDLQRKVLRDPVAQAAFERRGYVVIDLIDGATVADLYQFYAESADAPTGINDPGAYNDTYAEFTVIHSRPEFRRAVFQRLSSALAAPVDAALVDHRPLYANYVNKPPGTGVVPAHQNFAVVDEARYRSVSVWVALVDCEVVNGAMWMAEGSHRRLRGHRGLWAYETFAALDETFVRQHLRPVPVRAGQAVVLDDAILHYSPPNKTDKRRLAIQLVMIPAEAEARWYQVSDRHGDDLAVEVWRIDDEAFFYRFADGRGDPAHGEVIDHVELTAGALPTETIEALLGTPASQGHPAP